MRGLSPAAILTTLFALMSLVLPPLSVISSAVVGLVTLRKGSAQGLSVIMLSATVSLPIVHFSGLQLQPSMLTLALLWLPLWGAAALLRYGRSLALSLQGTLLLLAGMLALLLLAQGDPAPLWASLLQQHQGDFADQELLQQQEVQRFLQAIPAWLTGVLVAAYFLQLALALFLARSWQALLFNPNGFAREFEGLEISRSLGVAGTLLLLWAILQGGEAPALVRYAALLWVPLYFILGMALIHYWVRVTGAHPGWLIALYVLLLVAMPHAEMVVMVVGFADSWMRLRLRLPQPPDAGS